MFKHLDMWYMASIWTLAQPLQCYSRPDSKVGPMSVYLWREDHSETFKVKYFLFVLKQELRTKASLK